MRDKELVEIVIKNYQECWNRMGNTGADNYEDIATDEEKMCFNQFLVWEYLFSILDIDVDTLKQ